MNNVRATRARTETFVVALLLIASRIVTPPQIFKRGAAPNFIPFLRLYRRDAHARRAHNDKKDPVRKRTGSFQKTTATRPNCNSDLSRRNVRR